MRKIVTPVDIAVLFGKRPHHKITVTEFAAYFGISTQEIEDIIFFNDN